MPSLRERLPSLCRVLQGLPPSAGDLPHQRHHCPPCYGTRRLPESDLPKQPRRRLFRDVAGGRGKGGKELLPLAGTQPTATAGISKLQSLGADLDDLINTLIRRNIKVVLLRNPRRDKPGTVVSGTRRQAQTGHRMQYVPAPDEMATLEMLD